MVETDRGRDVRMSRCSRETIGTRTRSRNRLRSRYRECVERGQRRGSYYDRFRPRGSSGASPGTGGIFRRKGTRGGKWRNPDIFIPDAKGRLVGPKLQSTRVYLPYLNTATPASPAPPTPRLSNGCALTHILDHASRRHHGPGPNGDDMGRTGSKLHRSILARTSGGFIPPLSVAL